MISILLVDDEPDQLEIARIYLEEQRGFRVEGVTSAKEALLRMQKTVFDVIVADYQMPEMNGIEFLKKVQGKNNFIPFIIFSRWGKEEIAIEALNAGADFYLQKSGDPEVQFSELSHIIRKVVRQHRAEEALAKSEERYRHIIEGLTDYLYTVRVRDGLAVATTHSAACLAVTGYTTDEFATDPNLWIRMVFPEDRDRVIHHFSGVLSGNPVPPVEHRIVRKDGQVRWVQDTPVLQLDPTGNLVSYDGVIKDITERKKAEETLKHLMEFQESVITNARVWLSVLDLKGKILVWNAAAEEISGYRSEEVVGQNVIWKLLYPKQEYRKQITDTITRIISDRKYLENFETTIRSKEGYEKVISWNTRGIPDATGRVSDYIAIGVDITDRIRAEELRHESERRMTDIISFLPDATFVIDKNGIVLAWNRVMEEMTGVPAADIIGKGNYEYALPFYHERRPITVDLVLHDDPAIYTKYPYMQKEGKSRRSEIFIPHFNKGKGAYLWFIASPLYDSGGNLTGAIESIRDITERKLAEESLKISQLKLAEAMDLAHLVNWEFDVATGVFTFDDRFYAFYGTTAELEGGNLMPAEAYAKKFVHPDDQHLVADEVNKAIQAPDPGYMSMVEHRIIRRDGAIRHVVVRFGITKDKNGRTIKTHGANQDITERKRMEEALRESKALVDAVVENAPLMIFLKEATDLRFVIFNRAGEELLGYDRKALLGRNNLDLFPPEQAAQFMAKDREVLDGETGMLDIPEEPILTAKKGLRLLHTRKVCIRGADGTTKFLLGISEDITDRKELEKEREHHEQELQKFSTSLELANKKLTLLSSITRHDINNQLAVLVGYLRILEKKQPDTSFSGHFKKINTSSQRISAMIQFTKEYEQIGVHAPAWQDCRTLVDTATKNVPLGKVMVKNDLPSGAEVFADALVVKVCYNLMDNAVRYGGKITTIRFSAEESGDGNHIVVCEDDGDGVVAEDKEKIFERGFGKNTGMGLFLVREILSITGITIKETGEPGTGARFEMAVPKRMLRTTEVKMGENRW